MPTRRSDGKSLGGALAWGFAVALAALGAARAADGEGQATGPLSRPSATSGAAPGYIDDRICATCHRDLFDSYQSVGMARSFYRPRADRLIEDFDNGHYYHEPSNRHYEMTYESDRLTVTRYQVDEAGQRVNVLEQTIDWILGSGSRARSYIYQTAAGELFLAPISWYSQPGAWRMSPGYDNVDHKGFGRSVSRDCMFCHNALPNVPEGSDVQGEPALFPAELPEGIGCQRCHGPGARHALLALEVAPIEIVTDAILDPADLDPARRFDVCMQCHLQPSVAISPIRRFDRPDYSFRPGEALSDYLVHLDPVEDRPSQERFEINHHAYRLRQSRCFLESRGELSCLNCHDPHRKVPAAERQSHYRAACQTCHAIDACTLETMAGAGLDAGIDAGDCITCHMQPRRTQDVVHAAMTDHLIRRRPESEPQRLRQIPEARPRVLDVQLLDSFAQPSPDDEIYRAIAMIRAGSLSGIDKLTAALAAAPQSTPAPYLELVVGQLRFGRFKDAIRTLDSAASIAPDDATVHLHMGVALSGLGRREQAAFHFERALELAPERPEVRYNLGKHLAVTGRGAEAVEQLEAALRIRPNLTAAWFDLGILYANLGRTRKAAEHFQRALALEPTHGRARAYLDRLLAGVARPAAPLSAGVPAASEN